MRRIKKILIIVGVVFLLWAIINPFLFRFKTSDADATAAFAAKGMNIRTYDFRYKKNNLHYLSIGDTSKNVLLFVHGSPGCWDFAWDYFMDSSWHSDYELISIDRPGFGSSNYGKAKNLFEQSEIITAFVKEKLGKRTIQLVGHSYGGPLILQLCADNDSLYDKCFIMAGSVSPVAEKDEWQLKLFTKPFLKWMIPGAFEQGAEELLWLKSDLNSKKYISGLAKIKTSVVGVYGTDDNMVPYQPNVFFLKEKFDSMQLEVDSLQGANHFLPWKNYDAVKRIIRAHCE